MVRWLLAGAMLAGTGLAVAQRPAKAPELAYQLTEGQNLNAFVREGQVAAHLLLRNGTDPRILVAFPAGNSGVGLWFAPVEGNVQWTMAAPASAAPMAASAISSGDTGR